MTRLSFQFMNDPLRVASEGPFWASMFVVLGAVVGFGGTIEVRIYFLSGRPRCVPCLVFKW